jgi:hypothetical protein
MNATRLLIGMAAAGLLCAAAAGQAAHDHAQPQAKKEAGAPPSQKPDDPAARPAPADPHAGHGTPAQATPKQPVDPHAGHGDMATASEPAQPDPRPEFFRGKKFSEFNHRVAGLFVCLAGIFYLLSGRIAQRWPAARYAWPMCLLVPGLYLIIFSDPKWPFGPRGFVELLQTNQEFLQHKLYATILISLGLFEYGRARGYVRGTWSAFVFPALGVIGALMLLVHPHGGGQHTPEHMASMVLIQNQHLMFTIVGVGIALAKALSEVSWGAGKFFLRVWPSLMLVLGVMLMFYAE